MLCLVTVYSFSLLHCLSVIASVRCVNYCLFFFSSSDGVGYCNCALCLAIVCSFSLLLSVSVIGTEHCVLSLCFVSLPLSVSVVATVRCDLLLILTFLFFVCRLL